MATEAQIRANRLNAQKSTGPRSKGGKDVVSQNAVKHGLCANKHVIRSESGDEYNQFREGMIVDLKPAGAMELVLAERIVSLSWRLKRAEYLQNSVIEALIEHDLLGHLIGWDRSLIERARDNTEAGDADLILGIAVNRDFAKSRTLDLLLSYERRIESSLYKAASEFRRMQKMRLEKQSQIEEEYRTQNTENRREFAASIEFAESHLHSDKHRSEECGLAEEAEQVSEETEDVIAAAQSAKQSQSRLSEDCGGINAVMMDSVSG